MEKPITLHDLRRQSGLPLCEIIRRMQIYSPKSPTHYTAILRIEHRGCDKVSTLRAFAAAIGMPFELVEKAAANSRQYGAPCHTRRGRPSKNAFT